MLFFIQRLAVVSEQNFKNAKKNNEIVTLYSTQANAYFCLSIVTHDTIFREKRYVGIFQRIQSIEGNNNGKKIFYFRVLRPNLKLILQ
jgi:hypothetical protein